MSTFQEALNQAPDEWGPATTYRTPGGQYGARWYYSGKVLQAVVKFEIEQLKKELVDTDSK